jgi:AraC family transcriptional regulator
MKYLVAIVIIFVLGLVGNLLYRLGSFKPVTITQGPYGPLKIVFKKHVGAYDKIVPVIEEVETWAQANGEPCKLSFGEYVDDPDKVVTDRLRSTGGCVVNKKWDFVLPAGFGYREIPNHQFVIATFDGAPSIGPIKVYPKAKDYIEAHRLDQTGPTFELYEVLPGEKVHTTYLFPVVPTGTRDPISVGGKDDQH